MYINNFYKQINEFTDVKDYRKELKLLSDINLRRSSKSNVMGVIGAINVLKGINYSKYLNIYIASEYSCIEDIIKVLDQVNDDKQNFVMPFDFLNINGNNTGFHISKAINTIGNNMTITSEDFSFEKALEKAFYDFKFNSVDECLIGAVDESLENIPNYYKFINNVNNYKSKDGNCWFYISKTDTTDTVAKIKNITLFDSISSLNNKLKTLNFDLVNYNQYAHFYKNEIEIPFEKILGNKDNFFGTQGAVKIIELLENDSLNPILISLDSKKRAYLIELSK